jgi:23S rRNA pseudouridine2605 synthase
VDGAVVRDPERRTDPDAETIAVDGAPVAAAKRLYYVMNKPVGVLTAARDPAGRKTVYDVLREAIKTPGRAPGVGPGKDAPAGPAVAPDGALTGSMPWLQPAGRLDAMTLGLLVFTNDTAFARLLTDHQAGIPKTYEVKVRRQMDKASVERLRRGVTLDDGYQTLPAEVRLLKANEGTTWLEVTIREGHNRQVRRMVESVGHEAVKLRRVRIGPIELGDLPAGAVRPLTRREVEGVRALARGGSANRNG